MNERESLLKGILNYSLSTWVNLVVGFLAVVVTTRVLNPEAYGEISIFLAACNVLMYFMTLGMDGAYIRFYNEPPKKNTRSQMLYKSIVISLIVSGILALFMVGIFPKVVSEYVFGYDDKILVVMLLLYTICHTIFRYLNITFRMGFKVKEYNIQNIFISCLARILIISAAIVFDKANSIIIVVTVGTMIVLAIYLFVQRKDVIPVNQDGKVDLRLELINYGEYIRFALLGAPTYIVTYLNTFFTQQIIRVHINTYATGIYSSTGMFSTILAALKGGFATYWSAYVYKNYDTQKDRIKTMHDYVVIISIAMASILVIMRDVVYIFIGQEYHESKNFFSLILLFPILSFVLETTEKGIALAKKNEITLLTHVISVLMGLWFCKGLIGQYGLRGAACANALSAIILYTLNTIFGQKYYKTIERKSKSISGIVCIILILFIPSITQINIYIICSVLAIDMVAVIFYWREVRGIVNSICLLVKNMVGGKNNRG